MKVALIQKYKENFKEELKKMDVLENTFYFEILDNWNHNWNVEQADIADSYDKSLQSKQSGRLWGGSQNSQKSMMLRLMNADPDFVRASFRDLFNEKLDLGLRLDRFSYHIDQVFRPIQSKNLKLVSHMHDDRQILCFYLAMEYPEAYCLFDYPSFSKMMVLIESRNTPTIVEVERYYKSCRGIYGLLQKDSELMTLLQKKIGRDDLGLMVMNLFMEFISTNNC